MCCVESDCSYWFTGADWLVLRDRNMRILRILKRYIRIRLGLDSGPVSRDAMIAR